MSYSPNYPVSADVLANPTALTNRDDAGFELHGVISRMQDILEALEAKVGIGSSTPPATAAVLRRTATGASGWAQAQPGDLAAGGTANRLLGTTDGAAVAMTTVNSSMVPANALNASSVFGGGTGNRVLRTTDGTNAIWGQAGTADIADGAVGQSAIGTLLSGASAIYNGAASTPMSMSAPCTLATTGGPVMIVGWVSFTAASVSAAAIVANVDGAGVSQEMNGSAPSSGVYVNMMIAVRAVPSGTVAAPVSHTFGLSVRTSAGVVWQVQSGQVVAFEMKK
jgi:hypothetical protein